MPITGKLFDWIWQDVGARTALLATKRNRLDLAIEDDNQETILVFFDNGVMRILQEAGIVVENKDEAVTVGKAEPDPSNNYVNLVPFELWSALSYWILHEWFGSLGEADLQANYRRQYEEEKAKFKFTPGLNGEEARITYRGL